MVEMRINFKEAWFRYLQWLLENPLKESRQWDGWKNNREYVGLAYRENPIAPFVGGIPCQAAEIKSSPFEKTCARCPVQWAGETCLNTLHELHKTRESNDTEASKKIISEIISLEWRGPEIFRVIERT